MNLILLSFSETFKMVWLDSMRSKHADLSLLIFGHEIMGKGVIKFMFLLFGPFLMLSTFTISLFLSQYSIDSIIFHLVQSSVLIMLGLSLFKHIVNMKSLSIEKCICFSLELFLCQLLIVPIRIIVVMIYLVSCPLSLAEPCL